MSIQAARSGWVACAVALAALGLARPAGAFEFADGAVQVHGFYEMQLRSIANDYSFADDLDLTQWYNVLNVEIEAELFPDGLGPFDYIAGFARVEVRYDCVWTRGCGMFPAVDTFGDRSEHLPKRLAGARRNGFDGTIETGDTRPLHLIPIEPPAPGAESELDFVFRNNPVGDQRQPVFIWHVPGVSTLFGVPGLDGVVATDDDPAFITFATYIEDGDEYRWATRRVPGAIDGGDNQFLGPWLPKNEIIPLGALSDVANPFNPLDINPASGQPGSTALPFRPAPNVAAGNGSLGGSGEPQGLFLPPAPVRERISDFDLFDQNFTQNELAWNHGASQQDERELKELYVDMELFLSRLWIRAGKQTIVWGKTELFRTTDQLNPVDIALASLPTLEESRIALWAVRGVWSFGSPSRLFEDLRLEVAVNLDDFEPTDLGRCGEPYTPNPVCTKTLGLFAHGLAGFGLAGEQRPPAPWNSLSGLEVGVRAEWRSGIFSFALTNFWGYEDMPFIEQIFSYERNVDPVTGRPRRLNSRLPCDPNGVRGVVDTRGCLAGGQDALFNHHANQQRFAVICSSSVGFSDLDRSVCAQSVFNSQNAALAPGSPPTVAEALSALVAGQPTGQLVLAGISGLAPPAAAAALVPLSNDPGDATPGGPPPTAFCVLLGNPGGCLAEVLSDQQEALLGCGPFWGTSCDVQGIDLLNAELSALGQSWAGFPGTFGADFLLVPGAPLPGTTGFQGGPVCTRFENGQTFVLPGCGPDSSGLAHPLDPTQTFVSEMAALSYNFQVLLVTLSGLGVPVAERSEAEFDPTDPFRTDGCSFAKPTFCSNVQAFYSIAHTTRTTVRAGGNGRFGRTDFDWHVGGIGVLRYEKRNVLGFSMDFAEDRTKTSWSIESTWINDIPMADNNEFDGLTEVDTYNLTISMDRPTFVNFLNANRTLFINTQWFFQYVNGYKEGFTSNGPWNVLFTFTVNTGYFQDRLLQAVTFVYDFGSNSGAVLPEVTFRYTESFSITVGMAIFTGRFELRERPIDPVGDPPYGAGRQKDKTFVENGLSAVRDRDEIFLRIRYTF